MSETTLVLPIAPEPVSRVIRLAVELDPGLDIYVASDQGGKADKARAQLVVEILKAEGLMPTKGQEPELRHVLYALYTLRGWSDMIEVTAERPEKGDGTRPAITQRSYLQKHNAQTTKIVEAIVRRQELGRLAFLRGAR